MNLEAERKQFESWWNERLYKNAETVSFSRNKNGEYRTQFMRDAWAAWLYAIGAKA